MRQLTAADRALVLSHHLALSEEDRVLRFGSGVSDEQLRKYVDGLDFSRDCCFGFFDETGRLLGFVQVSPSGERTAEVALSVAPDSRGRGLGHKLLQQATRHCGNRGIKEFVLYYMRPNRAMGQLAARLGMAIKASGRDVEACLSLDSHSVTSG